MWSLANKLLVHVLILNIKYTTVMVLILLWFWITWKTNLWQCFWKGLDKREGPFSRWVSPSRGQLTYRETWEKKHRVHCLPFLFLSKCSYWCYNHHVLTTGLFFHLSLPIWTQKNLITFVYLFVFLCVHIHVWRSDNSFWNQCSHSTQIPGPWS